MVRLHQTTEKHENLERWLLTYADMITLLTAFFLMLYSMSVVSKGKFAQVAAEVQKSFGKSEKDLSGAQKAPDHPTMIGILPDGVYRQYEEALGDLNRFVEQKKMTGQIMTRNDERGLVITLLSDSMLFQRGNAQMRPENADVLQKVARIIQPLPNTIQIEGHTCNLPIHSAQFPSNWELSSNRAGAVLRYFTEQMGLENRRFVTAGYGDTRPLQPNVSEEARSRNRRVEIVILKSDEQREADLLRRREIKRVTTPGETN